MYRVTVVTDGVEYPLHEPYGDELKLIDPVVTLEMGKNCMFKFRISPKHEYKDKIVALRSEIYVYDNDEPLFVGRHIGDESDFYNIGSVTCEGELAYLLDSIQRPYDFTGSTVAFVQELLKVHNSQVEERKRFEPGNITIADRDSEVRRADTECRNTLDTMKAQLTGINGGYLRIRRQDGKKYLDYVNDYGGINSQAIRFGENLLDMARYTKPTSIITALIPYGAVIETDNTEEEEKRLDITGVNGGKDYIYNQQAVDTYGWIWGTQTFDDATLPEALLAKAEAYLTECIAMPETLNLKALDLGLVDVDVQKLKVGWWTDVESVPHRLSKRFMLSKKVVHLYNPGKDEVVLGKVIRTFTGATNKDKMEISGKIDRVVASTSREIIRKIENATQLITGGKGGYVVLDVEDPDTGKRALPWRILIMDTPDKDTAVSVIQINKNGIGFSTTGINGPYRNAWTIDGNLLADFITAGTMLADRIRGGTLEIGGSGLGKDGHLVLRDSEDRVIGSFSKDGIVINGGKLELGGSGLGKDGHLVLRDSEDRVIGSFSKDGIVINGGKLELGGSGLGKDGRIVVKDANDNEIGSWDKTGLHVLLGVIEGSTVKGSSIIGGTINIGNGTFAVDKYGSVGIESGEINIGSISLTDNYAWIYGFGIADRLLYSRDAEHSVEIGTGEYDIFPAGIVLKHNNKRTNVSPNGIVTSGDIFFDDLWTENMSALDMFKDLYNRVRILKDRINELEG